ncbi:hypothetical protein scyTo_0010070 [Scyliorhinus torazame]|uniref:Uncharacterized protein n=1 Tax=Scyliorhinus torazame TaxID=75743 RepID=A0A401NZE3_SCYTO|nr:hypothetical protein [Scyliorhinus torazame]
MAGARQSGFPIGWSPAKRLSYWLEPSYATFLLADGCFLSRMRILGVSIGAGAAPFQRYLDSSLQLGLGTATSMVNIDCSKEEV